MSLKKTKCLSIPSNTKFKQIFTINEINFANNYPLTSTMRYYNNSMYAISHQSSFYYMHKCLNIIITTYAFFF